MYREVPVSFLVGVVIIMLILALILGVSLGFARHGAWQDHYWGAGATPCCGARDCKQAPIRLLGQTSLLATIEVNGIEITIPSLSLHTSEDLFDYWCAVHVDEPISAANTRCAFIAVGS